MKFPVDILANVSQTELEHLAHNYMTKLLYSDPDAPEHLTLSDSTQVTIDVSSVGFVPLYGSSDKQKILALFSPRDPFTAVALYLLDRWWTVDHILNTADPSARHGAVEVKTIGERIVLYILNRVVYRAKEMSSEEELPFLCHGEKDQAKILWDNGEAVGFYSVKPAGSLCRSFTSRSYELPVMDSIFVRKCHRGKGFGLQMLEDFVLSFKEDSLGLRFPLTKPMYKVCAKFLCQYPGDTELLWEVEGVGMLKQRSKIASKIQAMNLNAVSKSLSFTEETRVIPEATGNDVVLEAITQLKETKSMVEIVEEVTVLRAEKEADLAVTARGRSSGSKKRKMGENIKEDKSEKIIRIEDIEAETPIEEQRNTELHNVSDSEGVFSVDAAGEEDGEDVFDIAPEEEEEEDEAAIISDKTDVTSAPITEEPQVEGDATQDLNNTFLDSQITVENVASEIEEEECHNEGTAVLVVSEDVSEVHKEADNLGKGTQIKVTDEMPEESVTVTEPVVSLLTHATSEDRKSRGAVLKAIQTVQSEPLRRRSRRHRSPEQTPTQEGGRVLRARTAMLTPTPTPKLKHTQHRQKVGGELQKVSTTKAVEELAANNTKEPEEITSINEDVVAVDETHQQEDDENTETQKELGVEDTGVKGGETVTDESEREQKGEEVETSAIQQVVSGDEVEEPPVVQKRAKPKPPPTRRSRRHKDQEEVQTDEADLETGASASEEKADENAMDKHLGEHQVESEETVDKTEEEISPVVEEDIISKAVEAAEDVLPLTEVNGKEQKVEASEQVMEAEKEEEPNDMIQQPDTIVATPETVIADEEVNEAAAPVAEEETQLIELITAEEEKEVSSCDAEKETSNAGVLLEEDPDKEKETCADVDEEKSESEDASVIGSGVLSSPETTEEERREQVKEEDTNEIEECLEPGVDVEEGKDVAGEEEVEPPPSEGADVEQGEATEEDKVEVVKEDKVSVEVEKTAEAAPMTEEENTVAADDLVEGDADTASLQPPTDTGLLVSSEEQTTTLAEEMVAQLPELQRVTVVLVDLNKSHHEVQEEPAEKEEAVEETAPEEEEETRDGTAAEAEPEKAVEQEERLEEKCEDAVTAEGTANDKDTVDEEETVTETRTRRVRKQLVKVTPRRQSSRRRQQEQAEEEQQDASDMEEDEPAVQIRVLRKGRKSAPVTQRSAKKRTRKQVQEEEGAGESTAEEQAEEAQLPIDQGDREKLEERDGNQQVENVENVTEQETVEEAVADGQEDTLDEESAETEKVTDEEEAPVVEPAGQIRVLRLGRRSAPATPRRKSKRARTSCQPEEEEKEDSRTEETEGQEGEAGQEVDQEKGEEGKSVEMETEKENDVEEEEVESAVEVGDAELTEEASTDQAETGTDTVEIPPGQAEETNSAEDAEDTAEDQAEEQADPLGEGLVAPAAQEDTESVEEEPSESKADQTVDSSVGEGRSVRRKMDTVADKEHQNRRSVRKIHRVDYRETDEEDGGGQTEAATDKEEEDGVEFSADEPIEEPEESSREGNMGAVESSSEKGDILNLVLDSEDQAETAGSGHDNEEDGQSTSDEEEEPIVIGKRVLRGRSVPSVTITPQSKSRRSSAKVQKAEMSEDEEESHQSSHKRSVHKRKCTEPTPTRKSKRASRV